MPRLVRNYQIQLGESAPAPICELFLLGSKGRVLVKALVDSGAYRSIFPAKCAEDAGIDLSRARLERVKYGQGGTVGRVQRVRIDLGPDTLQLDTEALFVERIEAPYALLGRIGFFDRFNEVVFLHKAARTPRFELRW